MRYIKNKMENQKKNFLWNTIGITFNAFTSLFFLVIINRINGTETGGIFSYTFSLACLFYIMAIFYNRTYQIADVKDEFSNNAYITNRIISCIITILFICVFSLISRFNVEKFLLLLLLMIYKAIEAFADCFHGFIQKKEQLYYVGKSLFFKALLSVILFSIVDLFTTNILVSIIPIIIVNFVGTMIDVKKYLNLYGIKIKICLKKSIKIYKGSLSLFIFSFLIIFINNCQKYVAGYLLNDSLQNVLGIIIMPATMLTLCGQYLINPYLTKLSNLYKESKLKEFKKILFAIIGIFLLMGILILIVAYLLGIPVLNILYSTDLKDYKVSFLIIIVGAIFYSISSIISNCLTILRKNNEQLVLFIISSIISIVLSIILIGSKKIIGASYAYFITMFLHCLFSSLMINFYLKERRKK